VAQLDNPQYTNLSLNLINTQMSPNDMKMELGNPRIAVFVHVYYCDLWPELVSYLKNIPFEFDLYVTMTEGRECDCVNSGEITPKQTFVLPNRGFDVGPFIHAIQNVDLSQYDYVCKIHSKKSLHRTDPASGEYWRTVLIHSILGAPNKVTTILYEMRTSNIGLVGSKDHLLPIMNEQGVIDDNISHVMTPLLQNFNIPIHKHMDMHFIGGTVFWIKPFILQKIKESYLTFDLFESPLADDSVVFNEIVKNGKIKVDNVLYDVRSRLAVDGQLAHGVERLFGAATVALGQRVAGV
jgi:lipopolysaccharide biosynthesis protein